MMAASLKIRREHLKQAKKVAAQHINHSSPNLTSPDIAKLGEEKQQKVVYAVNRGENSCTSCAGGNRGPSGIGSAGAGGGCSCKAAVGPHGLPSSSGFSYGWFNTALMLEGRSYLPWLTNR